jgi:PBSX family phage terminase large subunit
MAGAARIKIAMHRHTAKDDAFIITAPTYKILQQATLPAFLKIMDGYGNYRKVEATFEMHNGGTCYFRTATDPDSVVGITNVRSIWGDEAGLYPLYFHENIQARASFKQAQIIYTTSPYSLNWIYTDYIRRIKKGETLPDVELIQARSDENPYFPRDEFERKRATMDPRRFNMIYGGEFNKLEGLVYDCFDDVYIVDVMSLSKKAIFVAGVDWGYTNPAVIVVIGIEPDGTMYLVAEYYKTNRTIGELVDVAKRFKSVYNIQRFYCDPSGPANIVEFGKADLVAVAADNDIRSGVDALYEQIKSNKFKVFSGRAPNFLDEISIYHYPSDQDVTADKDVKEKLPVAQYNHAMDAVRYVAVAHKMGASLKRDYIDPASLDARMHYHDDILQQPTTEQYDW